VILPEYLEADQIVEEIKRQFRPLAERGRRPEVVEMSEQYAARLDSQVLRGHILNQSHDGTCIPCRSRACGFHLGFGLVIAIDESNAPAFGGVPIKLVPSPGILHVVMA
jgi:hypothetical protein